MALSDFLITDPVLKRVRKLADIERKQVKLQGDIKAMRRQAWALKQEYDALRAETKSLKKTGKLPPTQTLKAR